MKDAAQSIDRNALDVTLVEVNEKLRESEARFRSIADSVPVFIYMLRQDGSLEFINKPLADYHGLTVKNLAGESISTPLHPDDVAPSAQAFAPAFANPHPVSVEHRMRRADGEYRWFLNQAIPRFAADGTYLGFIGCCIDVHERKLAERAVEASERRYRSIFHTAAIAMWESDFTQAKVALDQLKATGVTDVRAYLRAHPEFVLQCAATVKTRDVNEAAVRLAEAESREHLLAHFAELFLPETLHEFANELADLAEERGEYIRESVMQTLTGKVRRCIFTVTLPPTTAVDSVLAAVIDITERKEAEELLQALNTRLLHAQEDERRRLAREMHDDVTQRLAVLANETAQLKVRTRDPELAASLQSMTEQIVKLSDDVHGISRRLHPSILEDLGVIEAIRGECRAFSDREGIAVDFDPHPLAAPIANDLALCLYRILQQGLRNVAKHAQTDRVHVSLIHDREHILLRVQDFGVGFDPTARRGKPGLGLASMRERAKLVGAKVTVKSAPGKGTLLELRAPVPGSFL